MKMKYPATFIFTAQNMFSYINNIGYWSDLIITGLITVFRINAKTNFSKL